MNGFESVTDFIGDTTLIDAMLRSYDELIAQARDIHKRLDKQAYLLDKYLSFLLEATNSKLAYCAS